VCTKMKIVLQISCKSVFKLNIHAPALPACPGPHTAAPATASDSVALCQASAVGCLPWLCPGDQQAQGSSGGIAGFSQKPESAGWRGDQPRPPVGRDKSEKPQGLADLLPDWIGYSFLHGLLGLCCHHRGVTIFSGKLAPSTDI